MKLKIFITIFILFIPILCFSKDRCIDYKTEVRIQTTKFFGPNFHWQYFLGQLRQESACRADITAFDSGMGIAQFMPSTSQYIQSLMGEKLNPYQPEHAIKMQTFYMHYIHTKENFSKEKKLWINFQSYNGGNSLLKKEYIRAGKIDDWNKMKSQCKRNKIKLKSGKILDFCDVNYSYSKQIFKFGNEYKPLLGSPEYW